MRKRISLAVVMLTLKMPFRLVTSFKRAFGAAKEASGSTTDSQDPAIRFANAFRDPRMWDNMPWGDKTTLRYLYNRYCRR